MAKPLGFDRPVLIYVPAYNCAQHILSTLAGIPSELHARLEVLVLDNQSTDQTVELVQQAITAERFPFPVRLIRAKQNLGYAGSQKLAYAIALQSSAIRQVVMLHGDGQYAPALLSLLEPYFESDLALVNGYRSKASYGQQEETPPLTFAFVKVLSLMESLLTGVWQREWHSGFVMYSKDFLARLPLDLLADVPHFDGETLICAAALELRTRSIPIYKRYKDYDAFIGMGRIRHVLSVFPTIWKVWTGHYRALLKQKNNYQPDGRYEIIV